MENLYKLPVEDRQRQLLLALGRTNLQTICERYSLDVSDRRRPDAYVDAIIGADVPMFQSLCILSRDELKNLCRQLGIPEIGTEKIVLAKRISRSIATRSVQQYELNGIKFGKDENDIVEDSNPSDTPEDFFDLFVEERRRLLLLFLGRVNLKTLCERFSLDVTDRRKLDAYIDAIIQSDVPMFQALSILSRDELKNLCQAIGVDDTGTEKSILAKRISRSIATRSVPEASQADDAKDEESFTPKVEYNESQKPKKASKLYQPRESKLNLRRTKVFVCYSHKDREWLDRLHIHLRPLHRQGSIDLWDDTKISPGMTWNEEIQCAIEAAKVAILMISARFLDSDFIYNNELPPLLDAAKSDGLIILPVIISPCMFTKTAIGRYQAINSPEETLIDLDEAKRERIFVKLASRIEELIRK